MCAIEEREAALHDRSQDLASRVEDLGKAEAALEARCSDLERRETGFPVEAVGGGAGYRTRKLVGRHKLLFGSIAASILALTVALAVIFGLYRQAEAARAAEAERFNQVRTLAGFMLFQRNDRLSQTPGNTAAREALAEKAQTYLSQLAASKTAPADLRLGASVAVTVASSGGSGSVALPATALFQQGNAPAVWVVRDDLTLELRGVRVERYESNEVLVTDGVAVGDRIVTAGVHRLASGERVRLLEGASDE